MSQSRAKSQARCSPAAVRLLGELAMDRDEIAQAQAVIDRCTERRALTIQRLAAAGVSLADIAEVAEVSRSAVHRIARSGQ